MPPPSGPLTPPCVSVPPRIGPFSFRSNAAAGIRVQVSCGLEQGDLPVTFRWLKDGTPFTDTRFLDAVDPLRRGPAADLALEVRQLDAYSSILIIPHLSAAHAGNYTCEATNAARSASFTAPLTVSGNVDPPPAVSALPRPFCTTDNAVALGALPAVVAVVAWCRRGRDAALHRSSFSPHRPPAAHRPCTTPTPRGAPHALPRQDGPLTPRLSLSSRFGAIEAE